MCGRHLQWSVRRWQGSALVEHSVDGGGLGSNIFCTVTGSKQCLRASWLPTICDHCNTLSHIKYLK